MSPDTTAALTAHEARSERDRSPLADVTAEQLAYEERG